MLPRGANGHGPFPARYLCAVHRHRLRQPVLGGLLQHQSGPLETLHRRRLRLSTGQFRDLQNQGGPGLWHPGNADRGELHRLRRPVPAEEEGDLPPGCRHHGHGHLPAGDDRVHRGGGGGQRPHHGLRLLLRADADRLHPGFLRCHLLPRCQAHRQPAVPDGLSPAASKLDAGHMCSSCLGGRLWTVDLVYLCMLCTSQHIEEPKLP